MKTRPSGCQLYCRKIEFEGEFLIVITKILLLQLYNLKAMFDAGELKLEEFTLWTCWPCKLYRRTTSWDISQQQRNGEEPRGFSEICFCLLCFHLLLLLQLQHSVLCFLSSVLRFLLQCYSTDNTKLKLPFFLWANCNLDVYIIFELLIGLEAKRIVTLLLVSLDQMEPAGMRWIVYKRTPKSSF